jgi:hypothetical protein
VEWQEGKGRAGQGDESETQRRGGGGGQWGRERRGSGSWLLGVVNCELCDVEVVMTVGNDCWPVSESA